MYRFSVRALLHLAMYGVIASALPAAAVQAADRIPVAALPDLPGPSGFVLPSDTLRKSAADEVLARIKAIESELALLPVGEFVRTATKLEQLKAQLGDDGNCSSIDLKPILDSLGTGADYLDNAKILQLRQALIRYQRTIAPLVDSTVADLYAARRAALEQDWQDYRLGQNEAALDRLRENFGWCVDNRQAEPECRVLREQLDHGNVRLKLDHGHMALLLPGSTRQAVPISTVSDGTAIRGNGILDITPRLVFLPNSQVGDLQLVLDGTMRASLAASRGRIQAWMNSSAQLSSSARVTLNDATLRLEQQPAARASSWTAAYAVKPPLNLPVIRRVTAPIIQNAVNRQLAEQKPQMDAMIAQQMSQMMAAEAKKTCEQVNRTYDEAFFAHLRRHGIAPQMRASTQAKALTVAYSFSDGDDFAGPAPNTDTAPSNLLAHESFLAGIERMLANKPFDADRFREAVFETIGLVPGEDAAAARPMEPTVVLAAHAPLRAKFRDQRLAIEVNVARVQQDDQTYNGQWQMRGEYVVVATAPRLVLRRSEAATVTGPSASYALTAEDAERFFPPTLEFSDYTGPGQMLKNAALAIRGVSLSGGWIRIDLQSASSAGANPAKSTLATNK